MRSEGGRGFCLLQKSKVMVTQPTRMEIPMKRVHMGNNKLSSDREVLYHLYLLRIHPYGVDSAYYVLIKVEYQLLINTIFLMDGVFRCITHLMSLPI